MLRNLAFASAAGTAFYVHRKRSLPDKFVLALDFAESPDLDVLSAAAAISAAATDPRVCGLVAKFNGAPLSLAQSQELGDAVGRFRKAKASAPTFAFAPEFDAVGDYLLACRFGSIVQQPGGVLRLPAASVEVPVAGDLLSRLGLRVERHSADREPSAALSLIHI